MTICAVLSTDLSAQSIYPGQHAGKMKKVTTAPIQVESFDLKDVRLLPSRFRDNMMRDSVWMTSIATNRLLHSFRDNAGVFAGREGGDMTVKKLGGWESLDCELRGHTTGHLLSAYALMYASTGSEIFKLKGDSLVTGLAEVQAALGNGYLSAYPEELINRNIRGTSVWAPWYTLHKLFSGLIYQYLYADNKQALEVVTRMGNWTYNKLKPLDESTRKRMIRNEFGGVNESFYNLYAITGDERYQWLAEFFYHNDVIDPLKEQRDDLGTKHTNTFIPKVLAEARNYELTQDNDSRKLTDFFWHTMIDHHTFAPGCSSDKEHYFDPQQLSKHLTGYTGETCCTYNMLKLSRHLFCWTGDAKVADYYERALYNHILGQQDPETGMVAYFLPLLSGSHKVYSTRENSFWCCVGSGFENHAKYGEAIYYHNDQGIYVNLFIPSEVNWKAKGITLRQETAFPAEENTALTIQTDKPVTTTIYLRYPSWSKNVKVNVNGKKVSVKQKPGSYIPVTRQWKDGDRIEANYPMSLQLETTPDNPQKGALLYGPLVLAGESGTEGMQSPAPFSDPALYNDYYTYNYHIPAELNTTLQIDRKHPGHSLQRTGEELIFKTSQGNVLRPLYDLHHQRYVVYWDLSFTSCRPADNRQAAYDFTPLDSIVTSWMNKGYYPGASICVVRDDSVIFQKNYKNFTPDTKVYVASAGKWVAAAVIGAVVDCTELDWNDSVKKWIPEFKNDIKGMITLRQLLSHTSGVRPYLPEPRVDNYNHLDSAVMEILPLDTVFTPGTRFEYGGLAMQIAGRMAEKAMNKEFEELFQELIARPLRMKNSHFTPVNTDGGHAPMLGGGLCTTLHDYMRFLDMIYHNGVFEEKQQEKPIRSVHRVEPAPIHGSINRTGYMDSS